MRRAIPLALAVALAGCGSDRPGALGGDLDVGVGTSRDAGPLTVVDTGLGPRMASSYPRYDLSFTLDYNAPAQGFDVEVEPRASRLDVHLNVDTTGSFNGEIDNLKTTIGSVVIPQLRSRVSDLAMGVSRFADFPISPFGRNSDQPYNLLTPVTLDLGRVASAVFSLDMPLQNGGDPAEAWGEALWQVATGRGYPGVGAGDSRGSISQYFNTAGLTAPGGVGFRNGSARVVVNVTDAPSQEPYTYQSAVPNTHSTSDAAAALRGINARLLGIASGEPARPQLEAMAIATGAVIDPTGGACPTGVRGSTRAPTRGTCPLVFDIEPDGSGLGAAVVEAIVRFLDTLAFLAVNGVASDDPHGFVRSIEAVSARTTNGTAEPTREDRVPAAHDGVLDTFVNVPTRTTLGFRVNLQNVTVPLQEFPQVFFVRVNVMGDGVVVAERIVRVIVPEGPKPDGGDARPDAVVDAVVDDIASPTDTGPTDTGPTDSGSTDAGAVDAGPTDTGPTDTGAIDAGTDLGAVVDATEPDAGVDADDASTDDVSSDDADADEVDEGGAT